MARASVRLIQALRRTALRLEDEHVTYRWSHFAHCNCGHLVQTLTEFSPSEIQENVVAYLRAWADLLEDRLSESVCDECEHDLPQAAE